MKKLFLFVFLIIISCSKENSSSESNPTNFNEAHVGAWKTTFTANGVDVLFDITNTDTKSYNKLTTASCYNETPPSGGSTNILINTTEELSLFTTNIPAANIFSGNDLSLLLSNGITTVSIADDFLHTSSTIISFGEVVYAGNTTTELLTLSGNFQKIPSFVKCSGKGLKSVNNYKLSKTAINYLTKIKY